jgi:hypothetical protein
VNDLYVELLAVCKECGRTKKCIGEWYYDMTYDRKELSPIPPLGWSYYEGFMCDKHAYGRVNRMDQHNFADVYRIFWGRRTKSYDAQYVVMSLRHQYGV